MTVFCLSHLHLLATSFLPRLGPQPSSLPATLYNRKITMSSDGESPVDFIQDLQTLCVLLSLDPGGTI